MWSAVLLSFLLFSNGPFGCTAGLDDGGSRTGRTCESSLTCLSTAPSLLQLGSERTRGRVKAQSVNLSAVHEAFRDSPAQYPANMIGVVGASGDSADWLSEGITIVVSTFRRDKCLEKVVNHWLSCQPKQLRVVWHDFERKIPTFLEELSDVIVDKPNTDDLTNRWLPRDFATRAVFSADDDVMYPCDELQAAYAVWRQHPFQLVGFGPRFLKPGNSGSCYEWNHCYTNWPHNEANTLFITKGGFAHSAYYELLWLPQFAPLRARVKKSMTAEDILMGHIHASHAPPGLQAPVPLLGYGEHDVKCDNQEHKALASHGDAMQRRCAIHDELQQTLGFTLQTAHFGDFYVYDKDSGSFGESMQKRCGDEETCTEAAFSKIKHGHYII